MAESSQETNVIDGGVPVGSPKPSSGAAPSAAREMVEAFEAKAETFFVDQQGQECVRWQEGDAIITALINSKEVADVLRDAYRQKPGRPIAGKEAISNAIGQLETNARRSGQVERVHIRTAVMGDAIFIDLANRERQVVKVTASGWSVIKDPPVAFIRTKTMLPMPVPQECRDGGGIQLLRTFLNLEDRDWILLISFLVGAFVREGSIPILILNGEQGSAKSTTSRVLKLLLDPNSAPIRTSPKNEETVAVAARHSWVLCFDNLSKVEEWLSDMLCRVSSGGSYASRRLYTDSEESVLNVKCPVILNGIPSLANRPDLADRAIILNLQPITDSMRRPETALWEEFHKLEPLILGALMDALSNCLANHRKVELDLPRMADFAMWVAGGAESLGFSVQEFSDAYQGNRTEARNSASEANPLADAIVDWITQRGNEWSGKVTELHELLKLSVGDHHPWFPKYASRLGTDLRRVAGLIRAKGNEMSERTLNGYHIWTIKPRLTVLPLAEAEREAA